MLRAHKDINVSALVLGEENAMYGMVRPSLASDTQYMYRVGVLGAEHVTNVRLCVSREQKHVFVF